MSYNFDEYRKAWDLAYEIDPPFPLNVDLELASLCNLRCPFCFIPDPSFEKFISQKSSDGKSLRRLMPPDLAAKIIDECDQIGVPALKFNWRGESTLHPEYSSIVKYAKSKRKFIGNIFATPGVVQGYSGPDRPSFHELLANTNANCSYKALEGLLATTKCMVSLDSMEEETYKKMRAGGDLNKAKQMIQELVNAKHPNLWVRRVLTVDNFKEPFFERVKERWPNGVHVSEHFCFDRNARNNLEVGCDHDGLPRKYCGYPSQRLVIASTGKVYPCCIDLHETMPMGDITKESLLTIWNCDKMRELRRDLRTNDESLMSETCRNCESWMAYDLPERAFVKDVEIIEGGKNGNTDGRSGYKATTRDH